MNDPLNFKTFLAMLKELDRWLAEHDRFIAIKAIGGFAVMCNAYVMNLKWNRMSYDIDSLTLDYTEDVKSAIEEIGGKI